MRVHSIVGHGRKGAAVTTVTRTIEGYHRDDEGHWVAELACGHTHHLRHDPPWRERPWVTTEGGRRAHLGTELACADCAMPPWPDGLVKVRETPVFDGDTIPAGLLRSHTLKRETWGRIVVSRGELLYTIEEPRERHFELGPDRVGVVEPEVRHRVAPRGEVRFRVEFHRREAP